MDGGAWWAAVHRVAKSQTQLSDFTFTFHFHASEMEMATHSSVLAWRIRGTGEPGGWPSMGSHRVRHDWSDLAAAAAGQQEIEGRRRRGWQRMRRLDGITGSMHMSLSQLQEMWRTGKPGVLQSTASQRVGAKTEQLNSNKGQHLCLVKSSLSGLGSGEGNNLIGICL